jgi:hypothetical protein
MTRHAWIAVLAALTAATALPLRAAETEGSRQLLQPPKASIASPITDRFSLRAGYYQPSVDMPLRYDASSVSPGTPISGEETLGFDDELNQGTVEVMVRMADRHRVRLDFFNVARAGYVLADQDIDFGENTYFENEAVLSKMDVWMLGLTYTYSLLKRESFEMGLGLGMHLMQLQGESGVPARQLHEEFDAAGPMATVAVDGTWRFTRRFSLNSRAQYLSGNVDDVDGSFLNYRADVQFRWRPNVAFGLGYTNWSLRVDSVDDSFSGRLVLKARGPDAFVRVSF